MKDEILQMFLVV